MGDIYPVEEVEGWKTSPVPKTYTEGTHFDIPCMGEGHGGQVFVFENEEDLNVMVDYYESLPNISPMLHSHLYVEQLVLLQIGGNLPKSDADAYGEVLEQEVQRAEQQRRPHCWAVLVVSLGPRRYARRRILIQHHNM